MATASQTFDTRTWRQGTRGEVLNPTNDPRARIINMRLYPDGGLGPRPRWKRYGQTASGGATTYGSDSRDVLQFGRFDSGSGTNTAGLFVAGASATNFYYVGGGGTHTSLAGVATAYSGWGYMPLISQISKYQWLFKGLWVNANAGANLTVSNGVSALCTRFGLTLANFYLTAQAVHQGRAFYAGADASSGLNTGDQRVYYSDAVAYTTFSSATQYFDVDGVVQGMASTGNNLLIWTSHGIWYVLQGRGNPANATLTKLGPGPVPTFFSIPANVRDNLLFEGSGRNGLVSVGPGGALDDAGLSHLAFQGGLDLSVTTDVMAATSSSILGTVLVPDKKASAAAYQLSRGAWTYETWGVSLSSGAYVGFDEFRGYEALFVFGGSNWSVYDRPAYINAPQANVVGDDFSETPTGVIRLPRISDPVDETRVVDVTVDARYWKGTSYDSPAMSVAVGIDNDGSDVAFSSFTDSGAVSALANATNIPVRLKFSPTAGASVYAPVNDVIISGITGFVVDRVTVNYETTQAY